MTEAMGDAEARAFAELVEPHRRELHAHCYRMLGSVHDADDALQDALLGAWKGRAGFEGRGSLRAWLYTIATNASLRVLRGAAARVAGRHRRRDDPRAPLAEPLAESVWIEPYPDELLRYEDREGVELAYVAALQLLPPNQRAVLLLRDVLGFSARESGRDPRDLGRVGRTARCSGPARSSSGSARPARSRRRCARSATSAPASSSPASSTPGTAPTSRRSSRCSREDATFSMPPLPTWFRGRDDIAAFLTARVFRSTWRFEVTTRRRAARDRRPPADPEDGSSSARSRCSRSRASASRRSPRSSAESRPPPMSSVAGRALTR